MPGIKQQTGKANFHLKPGTINIAAVATAVAGNKSLEEEQQQNEMKRCVADVEAQREATRGCAERTPPPQAYQLTNEMPPNTSTCNGVRRQPSRLSVAVAAAAHRRSQLHQPPSSALSETLRSEAL